MMKKTHKSAVIILLLLMTFGNKAIAQTPFHLINKSGTLYSFYLEDKPRFWHQGGLLHIHTDKTKINFVLAKVAQILWDNDIPTSILIKLSRLYDVSIDYLLGETNDPQRHSPLNK